VDGAGSWRAVNGELPGTFVGAIAVDPNTHDTLYAGLRPGIQGDGGVFKSTDGAGSWQATGAAADAMCGDGARCPQEQCDDGNSVDADGCDKNCTVTGCGNGIVTAGEECDDWCSTPLLRKS
jgi:cysteine-rich repeat protein